MTYVGWLADEISYVGGAELTEREFRKAASDGVEIVPCPHGEVDRECDVYVIQNCVTYDLADFGIRKNTPVYKYWNDVGSWMDPAVTNWLLENASHICNSPLQAGYMGGVKDPALIPPPVDLKRFADVVQDHRNGREGTVSVASWRNMGKGAHQVMKYAKETGQRVDFYGGGAFAPEHSAEIAYELMPRLLSQYRRFVFLPTVIEPFGRSVAEAWASGCEIVTNGLVGAVYWITEAPEAIETATDDFWSLVLR